MLGGTPPPDHSALDNDGDSVLNDSPSLVPHPVRAPAGPLCTYGPRLAYTYFKSPAPRPETLNAASGRARTKGLGGGGGDDDAGDDVENHWFTVDDQLLYLSFFQDSGPLNAACL